MSAKLLSVRVTDEEYKDIERLIMKMSIEGDKLLSISEGIRIMIRAYQESRKEN